MKNLKLFLIAALTITLTAACESPEEAEADPADEEASELEVVEEEPVEQEPTEEEGASAEAPTEATVGALAPDFTLLDENGESHTLSDYRGQTVVLEWFNIPCPYVNRHYDAQTFSNLIEEFDDQTELTWLAVDTTWNNTPEDSLEWKAETADERPHDYPILQDPGGEVGRLYDAKTTPHMYVIDEEGKVEATFAMELRFKEHVQEVVDHLKSRPE